jgi:hypothetical protein
MMVSVYPTDFWNDSCSVDELAHAIEQGPVGALPAIQPSSSKSSGRRDTCGRTVFTN